MDGEFIQARDGVALSSTRFVANHRTESIYHFKDFSHTLSAIHVSSAWTGYVFLCHGVNFFFRVFNFLQGGSNDAGRLDVTLFCEFCVSRESFDFVIERVGPLVRFLPHALRRIVLFLDTLTAASAILQAMVAC